MKVMAKNIDLVSWFDKTGKAHPMRFRLENEDGEHQTIKIEKVIDSKEERLCGNQARVFTCQSNIDGVMKVYEIKYFIESCQWMLFKM